MNVYTIIGIVGIVCGILCALADVPLAYSGEKDQDISKADSSVGNICIAHYVILPLPNAFPNFREPYFSPNLYLTSRARCDIITHMI
ncbi:MAG: hypothetical protein J6M17_10535 [Ruminococcus sp.]|nr:hypothetical protein [Ruminococcus sp.]